MADALFEHPRLAAVYDALDGDRADLETYLRLAQRWGARTVLDVGCGTGTFALLLAERGLSVTGVDPAEGSLRVARAKPGAHRVRWVHGDATAVGQQAAPQGAAPLQVDLATMTANVAQAITDPGDWQATLRAVHAALRPGGRLVFESRDPASRAWRSWNRRESYRAVDVPGTGRVEAWEEVTDVDGPLVTFRATRRFAADGAVLTSTSTLRFREREELTSALLEHGYLVDEVLTVPERGGQELVLIARRPG